jgi:hypothetical protein
MKINNLLILETYTKNKRRYAKCQCDCGNETEARYDCIMSGNTKSCGCLGKETQFKKTHGMFGTRPYNIWLGMKDRCNNTSKNSKWYKDVGITYDKSWDIFENFWTDMKEGYCDDLTLERIDTNGNYEKSNCKWATREEQSNNKRNNHLVTYNNETKTVTQWSRIFNIKVSLILSRLSKNIQPPELFNQPRKKGVN